MYSRGETCVFKHVVFYVAIFSFYVMHMDRDPTQLNYFLIIIQFFMSCHHEKGRDTLLFFHFDIYPDNYSYRISCCCYVVCESKLCNTSRQFTMYGTYNVSSCKFTMLVSCSNMLSCQIIGLNVKVLVEVKQW